MLYCIDSNWTTLSIGEKNWCRSDQTNLVYSMARDLHMYNKYPHLKSMGNTVSAHICKIKVFRSYLVILYRHRLDQSFQWWKKIVVPPNDQIWPTQW